MPGISPFISHFVNRPSIIGVMVVGALASCIGSAPGAIHIVFLPFQTPTSFARRSCILPGVAAAIKAFMSSAVQPGGSLNSGWAGLGVSCAAGSGSFGSAPIVTTSNRGSQAGSGKSILRVHGTSPKVEVVVGGFSRRETYVDATILRQSRQFHDRPDLDGAHASARMPRSDGDRLVAGLGTSIR